MVERKPHERPEHPWALQLRRKLAQHGYEGEALETKLMEVLDRHLPGVAADVRARMEGAPEGK